MLNFGEMPEGSTAHIGSMSAAWPEAAPLTA